MERTARSASRSSSEPGNVTTPIRGRARRRSSASPPRPAGPGSPRSPGSTAARSAISSTCAARPGLVVGLDRRARSCLPTRTSETFVQPSAGSASSTALPCGSSSPGLSATRTSNRTSRVLTRSRSSRRAGPGVVARGHAAGAGSVERVAVIRSYASRYRASRLRSTTSAGSSGAGGSWSQPLASSQSRTNCLSNDGWPRPASYPSAGQNRDESGVSTSSIRISSPPANPNSNLVSARMMPALERDRGARARTGRA